MDCHLYNHGFIVDVDGNKTKAEDYNPILKKESTSRIDKKWTNPSCRNYLQNINVITTIQKITYRLFLLSK